MLDEVAREKTLPGRFLPALTRFLNTQQIDLGEFVTLWARACDVPPEATRSGPVTVLHAMRQVNSFRNRIAHVPFPHDPLAELSTALERLTEQLFSIDPKPLSHESKVDDVLLSSPLTGCLRTRRRLLRGSQHDIVQEDIGSPLAFAFPYKKKSIDQERWPAEPFVHCDGMSRLHVATRLKGFDVCEYTRYRAEANAIFVKEGAGLAECCPRPQASDYAVDAEETPGPTPHADAAPNTMTLVDAIEAIRLGEFDRAIGFFEELTRNRPNYHVGWWRLGHARRQRAVRILVTDRDRAIAELLKAGDELCKAADHSDPAYKARARYERSKTLFQIWRAGNEHKDWETCIQDATEACRLDPDARFQSWWEYLERHAPHDLHSSPAAAAGQA